MVSPLARREQLAFVRARGLSLRPACGLSRQLLLLDLKGASRYARDGPLRSKDMSQRANAI